MYKEHKILILLFILFLTACSIFISQNVGAPEIKNQSKILISNETIPVTSTLTNVSLTNNTIMKKTIKNTEHTIEVLDVTENADACLIDVDGTTVLINKGETRKINGIYIFVADVRTFHSQLQNNDVCQLVIA